MIEKTVRIGDTFTIGTGSLLKSDEQITGKTPRVSVKTTENGILGLYDTLHNKNARHFNNVISVNFFGNAYYHPGTVSFDMKVHALQIPNYSFTRETGLYFTSLLNHCFNGQYSYGNQLSSSKLKNNNFKIGIPVYKNGSIAFDYIEDYIRELEAERIKELEAYLVATGLNNYVLTDEEKVVLNEFRAHNTEQSRAEQSRAEQSRAEQSRAEQSRAEQYDLSYNLADLENYVPFWGEFTISDIFKVKTPKKRFDANKVTIQEKGNPYVVRTSLNNGIRGHINEEPEYLNEANTISFGQDTATMFYQKEPYFTADKIKVVLPAFEGFDETKALFLITSMSKSFSMFTWGSSSYNVNVINSQKIKILLDTDGQPDYETMGIYIKAIEKLVIKDLVEWKDRQIVTTKIVTSR